MSATPADPDPTREAATSGRRRAIIVAVALLVVVGLVVVLVLATRSGSGSTGASPSEEPAFPSDPSATSTPVTSQDPLEGQAPPEEAAPVAIDATAEPVPGVVTSIGDLAAIDGVADGPGEVAGPALSFEVTVRNDTDEAVSLASTVVTVSTGEDRLPADALTTGATALPAEVAAGASATGTYVFTVPVDRRDDVRIAFDYLVGTPVVVFAGEAPRG
jgi:hypothetical protein